MDNNFNTKTKEFSLLGSVSQSTICVPFENVIVCYPKNLGKLKKIGGKKGRKKSKKKRN